ncbi:MAG: aldose 1-epimerase family protein, partial [Candidatus Latescibacteria bacterium]|nr:aldose 1-epimerase family protein [Candidatus Latescibacterota bacterium]
GFNEWIVRCGLDSNGAPGNDVVIDNNGNEAEVFVPLHGKIANTPARHVEVQIELSPPHRITVFGIVDETMMFGPAMRLTTAISTELGSNSLTIADRVTNLNHKPAELQLLYHCNYGAPLLEEGASLVAPFKTISPRDPRAQEDIKTYDHFQGSTPGYVEQVYFYELTGKRGGNRDTAVLLKNADSSMGSSLHFSLKQMPCFSLWKNTAATQDGYVTGLEPATNYPNPKRFERNAGRVVQLNSGQSQQYDLTIAVHDTKRSVQNAEREIKQLQKNAKPKVSENIISRLSSV